MLFAVIAILNLSPALASNDKYKGLNENNKFTSSGVISVLESKVAGNEKKSYTEEGEINGLKYRIFADGGGVFATSEKATFKSLFLSELPRWSVYCAEDEFSEARGCRVSNIELDVWIHDSKEIFLGYGWQSKPGEPFKIKVDSNEIYTFYTKDSEPVRTKALNKEDSEKLYKELLNGKEFKIRYTKNSNSETVITKFDLRGFREANQFAHWALKNLNLFSTDTSNVIRKN